MCKELCEPTFGPFWSVKYWAKATNSDNPSYFLESRHPKVIKNPYYLLPPEGCQRDSHGLKIQPTPFLLLTAKIYLGNSMPQLHLTFEKCTY